MRRMVSISALRSVKATTTTWPRLVRPRSRKRSSPTEWVGSGIVTDRSSSNAVVASSKVSRCLRTLRRALVRVPLETEGHWIRSYAMRAHPPNAYS